MSEEDAVAASSLVPPPFPDVRESTDAGAFYCAHTLYTAHELAPSTTVVLDDEGDPMVGFLHVPPDPFTLGAAGRADQREHRHDVTIDVVARALRGWLEQLDVARDSGELRVLVTGFGAFKDVADNPTGALCSDSSAIRRALDHALPERASSCIDSPVDVARQLHLGVAKAFVDLGSGQREVTVFHRSLDVDDTALDEDALTSFASLLRGTQAHAWLALGVCRSRYFRVEVRPTNAGLDNVRGKPVHDRARALTSALPDNRSLSRAIVRGVRATRSGASAV